MTLEQFLIDWSLGERLQIVGGSPLYKELPARAISINGRRPGAPVAAINNSGRDWRRVTDWQHVIVPSPLKIYPPRVIVPSYLVPPPDSMPDKQPTTCFSLLLICEALKLPVDLWGVCGWASKWHDGDWEMHYIKTMMQGVTVHDPRPQW